LYVDIVRTIRCRHSHPRSDFAIKRASNPIAVGLKRYNERIYADNQTAARFVDISHVDIWASNLTLSDCDELELVVDVVDLVTGQRLKDLCRTEMISLPSGQATELGKLQVPVASNGERTVVVGARLRCRKTALVLSRCVDWPQPFKFLTFPSAQDIDLKVIINEAEETITVKAKRPVKGLIFEYAEVEFDDNVLDLMPDDDQVVCVKGLKGSKLRWRFLGDSRYPPSDDEFGLTGFEDY